MSMERIEWCCSTDSAGATLPDKYSYHAGIIVNEKTADEAASCYASDWLIDTFDCTELEVWVRGDGKLYHGYLEMTDIDAKDDDGNAIEVSQVPCDMEYAGSADWTLSGELDLIEEGE